MQRLKIVLLIVFSGVLFTALFYHEYLGLNLFIFEVFLLSSVAISKKAELKGRLVLVTLSGTILTAVLVVIHNSALSITANFISIFLFFGIIIFPQLRNLSYAPLLAAYNLFKSQGSFIRLLSEGNTKVTTAVRYLKIFGIPIIVFFIFLLIYKVSNPIFEKYTDSAAEVISRWVTSMFESINIPLLLTFFLGVFLSNFFFLGKANQAIVNKDMSGSDTLVRKRRKHIFDFRKTGLIYEYKTGLFLFVILNLLLLIVNTIDVYWVWFNFEWNGQYLKQFVHEGTYLLIFSVLFSIVLTLYFFRGNLNFLENNKWLLRLSKLWLLQNAILVVSVAIRNFWYIHYFALAYKRIGVIFFLIAILFSLYFVFRKIELKKSSYYLFRTNSLAVYIILVSMTLFNWDVIIAKYNFSHYKTSFVHLDFLSGLSDKALPYLDVPKENLKEISAEQLDRFSSSFSRNRYMTPEEYYKHIQWRKKRFLREWPERSWLSWNLADWKACNLLTKKQGEED